MLFECTVRFVDTLQLGKGTACKSRAIDDKTVPTADRPAERSKGGHQNIKRAFSLEKEKKASAPVSYPYFTS